MINRQGRQTWHARYADVPGYNILRLYVAVRKKQSRNSFAWGLNDPPHFLQTAYTAYLEVTTETASGPSWLHAEVTAKQQLSRVIHLNLNSPEVLTTHTPEGGGVSWASRPRNKTSNCSQVAPWFLITVHSTWDNPKQTHISGRFKN